MPKILDDRVKAIRNGNPGMDESKAYAIATAALQREGKMKRSGTPKKVSPRRAKG